MDVALFRLINDSLRNPFFDRLMPALSDKDYVIIPGVVVLCVVAWLGRPRTRGWVVGLLLALALCDLSINEVLKPIFARQRPYAVLDGVHLFRGAWFETTPAVAALFGPVGYAFPSAHAANAAAAATALFLLKRKTAWVAVPLAFLVGYSRIYNGHHFPLDTVAGYVWGTLCGLASVKGVWWTQRRLWGGRPPSEPLPMAPARKAFLLILAAWTLFNFWFVCTSGFGLAGDEAQYWDWSRRLALGYYSKPPMVAYVMHTFVAAGGNQEWALRSAAVLVASGTLALIYALTLRITRREPVALLAAIATLGMTSTWVGAVLMTIDPLLVFFWALAMYAFHAAVNGRPRMWWLVGIAVGCGLLSKYTILFLLLSFGLYLLLADRRHWRTWGPYAALAVALACNAGVIYWNWARDWVSVKHTANIGAQDQTTALGAFSRELEFIGGQAGLVSPILFVFMVWAMVWCARRFRQDRDAAFLFLCFITVFGGYMFISLTHAPQVNWPVAAYAAAPVALAWAWSGRERAEWAKRLLVAGILLGACLGLAPRAMGLLYWLGSPAPGQNEERIHLAGLEIDPDIDPTNRLLGGAEIGEALDRHLLRGAETGPFPFSDRYQLTAYCAFYGPGRPRAYCMNTGDRRYNQYDLWGGWEDLEDRDGVFVTGGGGFRAQLFIEWMVSEGFFESGEIAETVEVRRGGVLVDTYTISRMKRYTGKPWPSPGEY